MPEKHRAIFLDRDGVINEDPPHFVKTWEEFKLLPHSVDGLKLLMNKGYRLIVVSNQACVARGIVTMTAVDEINDLMGKLLAKDGIRFDGVYICPHRDEDNCACRKPKPGMLLTAAKEFGIDFSKSYMIGDKDIDVAAGKAAGCKTILVLSGSRNSGKGTGADFICKDLFEAAELILAQTK